MLKTRPIYSRYLTRTTLAPIILLSTFIILFLLHHGRTRPEAVQDVPFIGQKSCVSKDSQEIPKYFIVLFNSP